MTSENSDTAKHGAPEETVLESHKTRKTMAWIALGKALDEFLSQNLTTVVDVSKATTLTEMPAYGSFGTVRELLEEAQPSLQILTMLKSATKHLSKDFADGELNPPTVVYLTTICVARLRLGAKITEFDDASLVERIDRLLDEGEFPDPIGELLVATRFKLAVDAPEE
jgi:hypothetical protein